MALGRLWAGRVYGTNTGNLFAKFSGDDNSLAGKLHFNDPDFGLAVYHVSGTFDGMTLKLSGVPEVEIDGALLGQLTAQAKLDEKGELLGEWSTDAGSSGMFALYPHDRRDMELSEPAREPEQLYTARYSFGAVAVDRGQIQQLASEMQEDFMKSEVVVTVEAGTEQTRLLSDFKTAKYSSSRANVIKLYVQQPETNRINRIAIVEFGPVSNMAMAQGIDEAWTLGMLEKLKRHIQPYEKAYANNIKKLGFGVNQFLIVVAIVFLPSLESFRDRAILMVGVLGIIFVVNWLHRRFLPHAAIYLIPKPKGLLAPNLVSWVIAFTSALLAALLGAYLTGLF